MGSGMMVHIKPYPDMKDSGVEWLGQVPAHWDIVPNRALFEEVRERDHPEAAMLSVTIASGVIRQHSLLAQSSKKDGSNQDKSAYKYVRPGDIAYNKMRAWQGALGVSAHEGIISPAYVVERPRMGLGRYFHYLMRTPAFAREAERWSYGITSDMWSLRPEHFRMIYSCFPPRAEQVRIVRFLDRTDTHIEQCIQKKDKFVKLLHEHREAVINHAVTRGLDATVHLNASGIEGLGDVPSHWSVRRLRNTCLMRVSNVDKHKRDDELPVRLCNYVDVYKNDRIDSKLNFMHATATIDEIERFRLRRGDVLITKDSETWNDIGVPALVEDSHDDLLCGYHLALLRPIRKHINSMYLFYALQTACVSRQFHVAANGVTRFGLSHNAIKSVWIPVPPLTEQVAIASFLDRVSSDIDEAIKSAQQEISLLREYRTRLIADVVTGKLDVREAVNYTPEESDEPNSTNGEDARRHSPADIGSGVPETES